MHDSPYENHWDEQGITDRIKYAIMNGVNTCILTGTGEAMQNIQFLEKLVLTFHRMNYPFPNVELQTTGVFLQTKDHMPNSTHIRETYPYVHLLHRLGVKTISLSVSSIFSDELNCSIIGINKKLQFKLKELVSFLKDNNFNVRLSLNMLKEYDNYDVKQIFQKCQELGANQVTFRKMYSGETNTEETLYVTNNKCSEETFRKIIEYVEGSADKYYLNSEGVFLYSLPFGGNVYAINGMSVVIDNDCMSKQKNDALKYIILRENGKLYCKWDNEGSLIF